jgi:hypothetical protein
LSNEAETVKAAQALYSKDEQALFLELGLREQAIDQDNAAADNPNLPVTYQGTHMGLVDDTKALGLRIMVRWNKELYGVVCGNKRTGNVSAKDKKMRDELLKALNLGDAAVIAAVVTGLMALGAPAAIAAPLAPLLVKKLIMPAKEELCDAWGEAMQAAMQR